MRRDRTNVLVLCAGLAMAGGPAGRSGAQHSPQEPSAWGATASGAPAPSSIAGRR
ncbi:MAG TPA: hypothetical protein VFF69_02715 [Phycisphaerales bacterium]|nr:hypothetical protein [Phycisphaerales bacterium]